MSLDMLGIATSVVGVCCGALYLFSKLVSGDAQEVTLRDDDEKIQYHSFNREPNSVDSTSYWQTHDDTPLQYENYYDIQKAKSWDTLPHKETIESKDHRISAKGESYSGRTALQVLEEVCEKIKLKENEIKKHNIFLNKMMNFFMTALMEEDKLFVELYSKILWSGSYYDGLKVGSPDEYDLNVVLQFPFHQNKLTVSCEDAPAAYAQINDFTLALNEYITASGRLVYEKMRKWCNSEGTLLQNKVREWFEGLMTKVMIKYEDKIITEAGIVKLIKSGPAMTLCFLSKNISIDLVPVFEFQTVGHRRMMPPYPFKQISGPEPWYAVPKPCEGRNDVWRLSFCLQERDLIHNKGRLKPAIKLLKKLRDTQQWHNLASYYIKTVFLWETTYYDDNVDFDWNKDLAQTFMLMINKLLGYLEKKEIKSFWDPRYNLLSSLNPDEITNMKYRLRRLYNIFVNNYDSNPEIIGEKICPS